MSIETENAKIRQHKQHKEVQTRQDKPSQAEAIQDSMRPNKIRQHETRQGKTTQDKTRQDKPTRLDALQDYIIPSEKCNTRHVNRC